MAEAKSRRTWMAGLGVVALFIVLGIGASLTVSDGDLEIPLDMTGGRPQLDVTIEGHGPYRFVLDTGSSSNVLDSGVARELGLEVVGEQEVGAPGLDQMSAEIVRAHDVKLEGTSPVDQEFVTVDLDSMSQGLFLGVLRLSAFSDSLVTLDLLAGTLRLSSKRWTQGSGVPARRSVRWL